MPSVKVDVEEVLQKQGEDEMEVKGTKMKKTETEVKPVETEKDRDV